MKTIESINMEDFSDKAKRAQAIAEDTEFVQYDFNGITCTVSPTTDIKLLLRDYINAGYTKNKSIGPDCKPYTDADTEIEIKRNKIIGDDNYAVESVLTEIDNLYKHIKKNPTHLGHLLENNILDQCYKALQELIIES